MKKAKTMLLLSIVTAALTACGNQEENKALDQAETSTDTEVDTAITQDPDTTTYHDMTL